MVVRTQISVFTRVILALGSSEIVDEFFLWTEGSFTFLLFLWLFLRLVCLPRQLSDGSSLGTHGLALLSKLRSFMSVAACHSMLAGLTMLANLALEVVEILFQRSEFFPLGLLLLRV